MQGHFLIWKVSVLTNVFLDLQTWISCCWSTTPAPCVPTAPGGKKEGRKNNEGGVRGEMLKSGQHQEPVSMTTAPYYSCSHCSLFQSALWIQPSASLSNGPSIPGKRNRAPETSGGPPSPSHYPSPLCREEHTRRGNVYKNFEEDGKCRGLF